MKINVRNASVLLSLVALIVYLFVSAPASLPQGKASSGEATVSVRVLFEVLAAEQAAARSLYTREVVGAGMKQGLKFSEEWKKPEIEAGPLPALLLREVSQRLQASGSGVGLFLGSDFPIATVNRFQGMQVERFELIKKSKQPEFFKDPSNGIQTAMFIDPASAPGCVTCHNEHPDSPKKDWNLGDPMGATTWLYPQAEVSLREVMHRLTQLRTAMREAYQSYLDRAAGFKGTQVVVGEKWPRDGLFLPDAEHFMAAVERDIAAHTVRVLMQAASNDRALAPR